MKFSEKTWFLKKNAFLKLENIHNLDTYFHPLRNIVLKLFDDECKAKVNTAKKVSSPPLTEIIIFKLFVVS